MAARARERFFDHGSNQWFDRGDEVSDAVVQRLGENELLFEKSQKKDEETPRRGRPRTTKE